MLIKKSRQPLLRLAIATAATALAGVTLVTNAAPASAASDLGGVSVATYCARNVSSGNPFVASKAVNINNTWSGWRCATINGSLVGVDMQLACRQQYPKAWWWQPEAWANHGASASSWRCYR